MVGNYHQCSPEPSGQFVLSCVAPIDESSWYFFKSLPTWSYVRNPLTFFHVFVIRHICKGLYSTEKSMLHNYFINFCCLQKLSPPTRLCCLFSCKNCAVSKKIRQGNRSHVVQNIMNMLLKNQFIKQANKQLFWPQLS